MSKEIIKCTDVNIKDIVKEQIELLGNEADLNHLDVSNVSSMRNLFYKSEFNGDISKWNVSSVTDMTEMFGYSEFNQDISKWSVSSVNSMHQMFASSPYENMTEFDQDISGWDMSSVEHTKKMFYCCCIRESFKPVFSFKNESIICTDDNIKEIIQEELKQKGDDVSLNHLDVSKVTNMDNLFCHYMSDVSPQPFNFNGDISKWDVSNVVSMYRMFFWCVPLSSDISKWDVSNVKSMKEMFTHSTFSSDISNWNVSSVTDMTEMLGGTGFNGDISKWNVSSVTAMKSMFLACPIPEENKPKFED